MENPTEPDSPANVAASSLSADVRRYLRPDGSHFRQPDGVSVYTGVPRGDGFGVLPEDGGETLMEARCSV
jgi:hypothetical protein